MNSKTVINTVAVSTLQHRAAAVQKCIDDRLQQAAQFRAEAIGNSVAKAEWLLTTAKMNEDLAEGMRRALNIMLG